MAAYGLASSTASEAGTICTDCGLFRGHCQSACAGPFFGTVPGCCQCQPHCCDNAWAGYCQEKARRQAFWHRVGTGGMSCLGRASGGCEATCVTSEPVRQFLPMESAKPAEPEQAPLPPLPNPVPEKTSWKWNFPWLR